MKRKIPLIAALLLFTTLLNAQQTSNGMPFTAVAGAAPVISSLGGLSPTGKIYTGSKLQIMGTGFTSNCNVNVDGAVQPGSSVTFVSTVEIDFTVPAGLGSALPGTSHTVSISCNLPPLAMNPIYPQGFSCDPATGIFYDIVTGNPNGCRADIETGIVTCVGTSPWRWT